MGSFRSKDLDNNASAIEESSLGTIGRHRRIQGKDYMLTNDIDGARSRYLINQEKREGRARDSAASNHRNQAVEGKYSVKDINSMDSKKKFLYRRQVDPLNPTYVMPSVNSNLTQLIGPIDGQRPHYKLNKR